MTGLRKNRLILFTEPFIVPGLYEKYANGSAGTAIDEYTLSVNMGDNITAALTEHYETFITEASSRFDPTGLNTNLIHSVTLLKSSLLVSTGCESLFPSLLLRSGRVSLICPRFNGSTF